MLRSHSGDSITEQALEAYSQIEEPRLREVMAALIRHLHALVKEVRLSEKEWEFAWDVWRGWPGSPAPSVTNSSC